MYLEPGVDTRSTWVQGEEPQYGFMPGHIAWTMDSQGPKAWILFRASESFSAAYGGVLLDDQYNGGLFTNAHLATNNHAARQIFWPRVDVPSGNLGWGQIYGRSWVRLSGAVAAGATLYTSSVAGALNDASASQSRIHRLALLNGTNGAGFNRTFMIWPSGIG